MKRKNILLACLSASALIGSSFVVASNRPGAITFTGGDAYYHFADKRNLDNIQMPNLFISYNIDERWALEAGAGLVNSNLNPPQVRVKKGTHGFLYLADGIFRFSPYGRFEPYLTMGMGILAIRPNGVNSEYQGNINAGVGSQFFLADCLALCAEARDLYTISHGRNDYMLNLGLSFVFGGRTSTPAPVVYKGESVKGAG